MRSKVLVLIFIVLFTLTPEISGFLGIPPTPLSNNTSNQCEENRHNGNFTCAKNEDNTYNATFDCHSNGHKKLELILQYPNFPKKTKHLTIQNCESLVLDSYCAILRKFSHEDDKSMIHISHLHILNISHIMMRKEVPNHEDFHFLPTRFREKLINLDKDDADGSWTDFWTEEMESQEEDFYYLNDLVADTMIGVSFENIKHAYIEDAHIPLGLFRCDKAENDTLEYFKMINLKALHFRGFSEEHSSLKEFIMDNVTLISKNGDEPLKVNNTKAVVKIANSNFVKIKKIFDGTASKVMITGNKAQDISSGAFSLEADEFIFSGNVIDRVLKKSFEVLSQTTQITNNKIQVVDDEAFSTLLSKRFDPTVSNHTHRIYNFSNNEINILNDEIFSLPYDMQNFYYDTITVTNNSISCSCQNVRWFRHLAGSRYDLRWSHNFWIKRDNQNKCLNIPNCTLAQVLNNFHELCESKYECPINVSIVNSSTNFFMNIEETLGNTLNINREISDTNMKILKILKSDADNHNHDNGSLLTINTFCLILLITLAFVVFGYLVLVKYRKIRELRPKRFSSLHETEMNSRVSLNP